MFFAEGWILRSTPRGRSRTVVWAGLAVWLYMSAAVWLFLEVLGGPADTACSRRS